MTIEELENAVRAWVLAGSNLPDGKVIFSDQNGVSPIPGPAAIIRFGDLSPIGVDATSHDYDVSRPAGQEIEFTVEGVREVVVEVSFFAADTVGNASARATASACATAVHLPSIRDALNAAGVGVMQVSAVRWVPSVDGGKQLGQAVLEARLVLRQTASERTGYISEVEYNQTITE